MLSGWGYTIDEIGAITGFHRNTVSRWLDQWAERGIDGILEREGRGRTPYIPYAWQDKGGGMPLPCRDGARINVQGLYSLTEGELRSRMITGKMTTGKVASFFDGFTETVKKMTVVVIDNASIYTAKAITEKLDDWARKGLYLYFLPAYSPELNLIEIVWWKVKYEWIHRSTYTSFKSLWVSLSHIFSEIGRTYNIYFA